MIPTAKDVTRVSAQSSSRHITQQADKRATRLVSTNPSDFSAFCAGKPRGGDGGIGEANHEIRSAKSRRPTNVLQPDFPIWTLLCCRSDERRCLPLARYKQSHDKNICLSPIIPTVSLQGIVEGRYHHLFVEIGMGEELLSKIRTCTNHPSDMQMVLQREPSVLNIV